MINKTVGYNQWSLHAEISYSFDEACFKLVAISRKKTQSFPHCGDVFLNGPVLSQVKEMK